MCIFTKFQQCSFNHNHRISFCFQCFKGWSLVSAPKKALSSKTILTRAQLKPDKVSSQQMCVNFVRT